MKTYLVHVRVVMIHTHSVQATSPGQAIDLAAEGEGPCVGQEYSHCTDSDTWAVEEVTP